MTSFYQISTEDMDGLLLQIYGMQQTEETTQDVNHWSAEVRMSIFLIMVTGHHCMLLPTEVILVSPSC